MRKTIVSTLVVLTLMMGFGIATAPPAAAYTTCPHYTYIVDWVNHQTCNASSDFTAENWQSGPYGVGWFARSAAYGYVPALCFFRTTRWIGAQYGAESRYMHYFGVKEDQDGNCNGPWWNVPVETNITLSFYNIYGVEEALDMQGGMSASTFCGSNPGGLWTQHESASSGGQVTGGSGAYYLDAYKCIPKRVGTEWKSGTYRVKQNVRVNTFPYQEYNLTSDHVVYN